MDPSSLFAVLMPLMPLRASAQEDVWRPEVEPESFGRVVEVITDRGRVARLHANRLRLSDNVSLGGVFNIFDAREDHHYTLNIRVTF